MCLSSVVSRGKLDFTSPQNSVSGDWAKCNLSWRSKFAFFLTFFFFFEKMSNMQKSWKNCTVKSHTYLPPRFYSYHSTILVLLSNLLILFLNPSHLFLKNEFQGKSETSVHFISKYSSMYNINSSSVFIWLFLWGKRWC